MVFLILIRLGLYIPVPNVGFRYFFTKPSGKTHCLGLAKSLTGSSFLGVGALGILPYINSSIIVQLLTPIIPALETFAKRRGRVGPSTN